MKYLFKGEPNLVVIDRHYNKILFRFDEKGTFITEDLHIIGKAYGKFDGMEVTEKDVEKTVAEITTKVEFICDKCGKICKNKLGLNAHTKACKGV